MKIFIICANHAHQMVGCKHGRSDEFQSVLLNIIGEKNIDLLAEELNEEALEWHGVMDSTLRLLASSLSMHHLYCEANSAERAELGVESESDIKSRLGYGRALTHDQLNILDIEMCKHFLRREQFWLEKMLRHDFSNCLLVCGPNHAESFSDLAFKNNIPCFIVNKKWEPMSP